MKKTIITISILSFLLFSSIAFASVSTVSTSMSTSRATTGTSVTATVTVTATGTESGSVQLSCTPSGVSISDPSSGQYQGVLLSTSPKSNAFIFTAGAANTYTCSGQSGGVSGDSTIVFVDPTSLSVTGTPTSKSVSASGATFSLSTNVQNSQSSAITTSYKLTCPSGYSASGDSSCDETKTITIGASSTTALVWTITTGSSSGSVTLSLGDNSNAFSSAVTVPAASTTTTTTTDTAAGGSAATTPGVKVVTAKGSAVITIPSIAAGKSATVNINKTEDVAVTQVIINVKNSVNNIQVVVTKLAEKPAAVTQEVSGKVYHYIEVNKTNITDTSVNNATLRFKVEKSWLTSNNVNESTVALYRYDNNAWNKLETTKIGDLDTDNILYEAVSLGLSVFAISGEQKAGTTPTTGAPTTNETQPPLTKEAPKAGGGKSWVAIVAVIAVVAGIVLYLVKKKVIKLDKIFQKKNPNWDELKRKYSKQ